MSTGNLDEDIDTFCRINRLEKRCHEILHEIEPRMARKVMGLEGGSNTFELKGDVRNPTAVVIARAQKAKQGRD